MLTKLDKLITFLIIIAAIASAPLAISAGISAKASTLTVFKNGTKIASYDFNDGKSLKIEGEDHSGFCLLNIKDNSAYIAKSTCPLKICQKQGRITKVGQTIVCAPMRLLFEVQGTQPDSLDAVND